MTEPWRDGVLPCADPECAQGSTGPTAEPEGDAELRYHQCTVCGYTFGWTRPAAAASEGTCAVGIPEPLRRAASAAMTHALAGDTAGPLLQIGSRRDGHHHPSS